MTTSTLAPSLAGPSPSTLTASLMAAKKAKGLSFADLEGALGLDEVWIASLFYGQATASPEEAEKLATLLGLDPAITAALQEFPPGSPAQLRGRVRVDGHCERAGPGSRSSHSSQVGVPHPSVSVVWPVV